MAASARSIKSQWKCGECGECHDYEDDARDCCPVRVTEVYVCPVCNEDHNRENNALECCPDPDADPAEPSRGPTGIELEALGQQRLIP